MKKWAIPPDIYALHQQQAGRARRTPDTIATIVRQGLIEDILFPDDPVRFEDSVLQGGRIRIPRDPVGFNVWLNMIGVKDRLSAFYRKQPYRRETIEFLQETVNKYDSALRRKNAPIRLYKNPDGVSEDTIRKDLKAIIRVRKEKVKELPQK
jgi:hypothetical protein